MLSLASLTEIDMDPTISENPKRVAYRL